MTELIIKFSKLKYQVFHRIYAHILFGGYLNKPLLVYIINSIESIFVVLKNIHKLSIWLNLFDLTHDPKK